MPKIYEEAGLVFKFYSSDLDEPPHIHVEYKEGGTMKVWLAEPELETAWIRAGMPSHKQTQALKIIDMILRKPGKLNKTVPQPPLIYPAEKLETYPLIIGVECTKEEITAFLEDGRKVSIPTAWYPRTRSATLKQLKNFRISSDKYGIHWPEIDEDLSIRAFFKGPSNH